MDLAQCPQEIVEDIVQYLDKNDILACLQVNNSWCAVLDSNRICRNVSSYHPNYFRKQSNKEKLQFKEDIEVASEGLSHLLKEKFVQDNIASSKYHVDLVKNYNEQHLFVDNIVDSVDNEGNHWMFVSCTEGFDFRGIHTIQVWNLNKHPILCHKINTERSLTNPLLESSMEFINNKLYHIYETSVLVLNFKLKENNLVLQEMKLLDLEANIFTYHPLLSISINSYQLALAHVRNEFVVFINSEYHMKLKIHPLVYIMDEEGEIIHHDNTVEVFEDFDDSLTAVPIVKVIANQTQVLVVYRLLTLPGMLQFSIFDVSSRCYNKAFSIAMTHITDFQFRGSVLITHEVNNRIQVSCYNSADSGAIFSKAFDKFYKSCLLSDSVLLVLCGQNMFVYNLLQKQVICDHELETLGPQTGSVEIIPLTDEILCLGLQDKKISTITYSIWNFKTGLQLSNQFFVRTTSPGMSVSFIRQYHPPPKLIFYDDPNRRYSQSERPPSFIFVLSFW